MKKILLSLSAVLMLCGAAFTVNHFYKLNEKDSYCSDRNNSYSEYEEEEDENPLKERQIAAGYFDYFNKMRANQTTGIFNINDYYASRVEAKQYKANGLRGALNLEWENLGPDNQGGRTRAFLIDNDDPTHFFAGGVSGGLWESTNSGLSWTLVNGSDEFESLIVSCIAQAGNGNIYFGTGEFFGAFQGPGVTGMTGFPGGGIWASSDNGQSFANIKAPAYGSNGPSFSTTYAFITDMATDPTDPTRVYVTIDNPSATNKAVQIINATNNTFTNCGGANSSSATAQDVDVASDGTVHAVIGNKYFKSATGGQNLIAVPASSGLPTSGFSRLEMAVSPTDPNYVYAVAGGTNGLAGGVWKSTDAGTTFVQLIGGTTDPDSQTWNPITQSPYAVAASVVATDKESLILGGLDVYRYSPSTGFVRISKWNYSPTSTAYVHADIHTFVFKNNTSDEMYVMSDGGINYTQNIKASEVVWATRNNGFITTQAYGVTAKNYSGAIIFGFQDNGTWINDFNGNTPKWSRNIAGGDGGDVAVSTLNPNVIFAENPISYSGGFGSQILRSSNNGNSFGNFYDCNIDKSGGGGTGCSGDDIPDEGIPFIAQFDYWENIFDNNTANNSRFFLATSKNVWMTNGALNSITTPTWFKLNKVVMAATGAELTAIEVSKDGKNVFVGTNAGNIYRISGIDSVQNYQYTFDNGSTVATFSPDSFGITTTLIKNYTGRFVTGIEVDENDANHIVVTLGNYANSSYVYECNDALSTGSPTFTDIATSGSGLPRMPTYCAIIDVANANHIIVGTEVGVYSTANGGNTWTIEDNGFPNVPVFKMYRHKLLQADGNQYDNVIVAATYGRGIFRTRTLQVPDSDESIAKKNNKGSMSIYPNPTSNDFTINTILPVATDITINIYSITGKLVSTIVEKNKLPGTQNISVNTSTLANGSYIVQVTGKNINTSSKLAIIK
jgi:hypothetical protein